MNLDRFGRMRLGHDNATAREVFRYIVRKHPTSANAYRSLAEGSYAAGDRPAALEAMAKALASIPEDPALSDTQKKQMTKDVKKNLAEMNSSVNPSK